MFRDTSLSGSWAGYNTTILRVFGIILRLLGSSRMIPEFVFCF